MSSVPGTGYRYRSIPMEQAAAMRQAVSAGVSVKDLAAAYEVTPRTIYRALRRSYEPVHVVIVGEWRTEVAMTEDGPVWIKPWVPA